MKTIKLNYKTCTSSRPEWLLYFGSEARNYFGVTADDTVANMFQCLSERLNRYSFFQRKLKRSCEFVKREITGDKLLIYNTTGTKILLEISYS
jgi:hypothetical protein